LRRDLEVHKAFDSPRHACAHSARIVLHGLKAYQLLLRTERLGQVRGNYWNSARKRRLRRNAARRRRSRSGHRRATVSVARTRDPAARFSPDRAAPSIRYANTDEVPTTAGAAAVSPL